MEKNFETRKGKICKEQRENKQTLKNTETMRMSKKQF
jgi:hypothetical protein